MKRRLALTRDGKVSMCSCPESKMGRGRCNHVGVYEPDASSYDSNDAASGIILNPGNKYTRNEEAYIEYPETDKGKTREEKIEIYQRILDNAYTEKDICDFLSGDFDTSKSKYLGRDNSKLIEIINNCDSNFIERVLANACNHKNAIKFIANKNTFKVGTDNFDKIWNINPYKEKDRQKFWIKNGININELGLLDKDRHAAIIEKYVQPFEDSWKPGDKVRFKDDSSCFFVNKIYEDEAGKFKKSNNLFVREIATGNFKEK